MNGVITRKLVDGFFREVEVQTATGPDRAIVVATAHQAVASALTPRRTVVETQVRSRAGEVLSVIGRKEADFDRVGREVITRARNSNGQMLVATK